ncbi:MAG TPA: biotin/lipoyl-containing protein, partial [Thermoanaerobaculia bacterium]
MAIDVVMPQMGESIAEGTVVRWIKKPGDKVDRDEPLLEISTDKVDAEIPSPAAGTLSEVLVKEGQTVAVNSVVARIAGEGESAKPAPAPTPKPVPAPEPPKTAAPAPPSATENRPPATEKVASLEERRRTKSSPLVRKIAAENN